MKMLICCKIILRDWEKELVTLVLNKHTKWYKMYWYVCLWWNSVEKRLRLASYKWQLAEELLQLCFCNNFFRIRHLLIRTLCSFAYFRSSMSKERLLTILRVALTSSFTLYLWKGGRETKGVTFAYDKSPVYNKTIN